MKILEYWETVVIADCEGKTTKVNGRFDTKELARDFSITKAGRDMYGEPAEVKRRTVPVMESLNDWLGWEAE